MRIKSTGLLVFLVFVFLFSACDSTEPEEESGYQLINPAGENVSSRFNAPPGFTRISAEEGSFAAYLRELPLKPAGAPVKLYDGSTKSRIVHEAVIDLDVGERDLQQCADAVIRLRAEYLYARQEYDKIHFNFTNGFRADYSKWLEGYRITVNGNEAKWVKKTGYSNDYESFRDYLEVVFAYAGTLSLSHELEHVELSGMKPGDVLIQGGSPGHCVLVIDMAGKADTKEKVFMLAQSYMPAQDIHILQNPDDRELSPWYRLGNTKELKTPEWIFEAGNLQRFVEE